MLVKDLPACIQRRVEYNAKEQGRPETEDYFKSLNVNNCFSWSRSKEGYNFWVKIAKGEFYYYYKMYPEDIEQDEKSFKRDDDELYKFLNS